VTVTCEDETITVLADGETWIMEIGSDDDAFVFTCDKRVVRVPFSNDYLSNV
jgi:hypothetical protein